MFTFLKNLSLWRRLRRKPSVALGRLISFGEEAKRLKDVRPTISSIKTAPKDPPSMEHAERLGEK